MIVSQQIIDAVWAKAKTEPGYDPDVWRKDFAEAWINKHAYGTTGAFGWEIDHRLPQSKGGSDALPNLFPCHWENNRHKGDDYPRFKTIKSSEGNYNVRKEQSWVVR